MWRKTCMQNGKCPRFLTFLFLVMWSWAQCNVIIFININIICINYHKQSLCYKKTNSLSYTARSFPYNSHRRWVRGPLKSQTHCTLHTATCLRLSHIVQQYHFQLLQLLGLRRYYNCSTVCIKNWEYYIPCQSESKAQNASGLSVLTWRRRCSTEPPLCWTQ